MEPGQGARSHAWPRLSKCTRRRRCACRTRKADNTTQGSFSRLRSLASCDMLVDDNNQKVSQTFQTDRS